jgi:hypothetical protein
MKAQEIKSYEEFIIQIRLLIAYLLLSLLFDPEDGDNIFLRNDSGIWPNYKPLLPPEGRIFYTVMNLRMLRPRPPTSSRRSCLNVGQLFAFLYLNIKRIRDNVAYRPVAKR